MMEYILNKNLQGSFMARTGPSMISKLNCEEPEGRVFGEIWE